MSFKGDLSTEDISYIFIIILPEYPFNLYNYSNYE
jgi:hypothetical protein